MATRSVIIVPPVIDPVAGRAPNPAFPFVGIYCHWDGYPEGVGTTLSKHYTDDQKITDLIKLGGLSSLGPTLEAEQAKALAGGHDGLTQKEFLGGTVAYHRDRGERLWHYYAPTLEALLEEARGSWCEYAYLRDTDEPSGWRIIEL